MGIYVGPVPPGPGRVIVKMCFTGIEATLFRNLLGQIQTLSTAVVGAAVGLILSFIFGPEVLPQILGLAIGAAAGAFAGGVLAMLVVTIGACPCPAGTSGFCISLIFLVIPGTSVWIPIWPFAFPDRGACTTVMPAGCP